MIVSVPAHTNTGAEMQTVSDDWERRHTETFWLNLHFCNLNQQMPNIIHSALSNTRNDPVKMWATEYSLVLT